MSRKVVLVDEAEQQLKVIDRWWLAHRQASPGLFLDELSQAIDLLSDLPEIGSPFKRTSRPGIRCKQAKCPAPLRASHCGPADFCHQRWRNLVTWEKLISSRAEA